MYRILVADDEPIILSGIKHLIDWKTADAEIAGTASNGAEAYRMIKSEHPDIVITDIRMPVMDGLALAGKCSEEFPDVVFIVLTSLAEFSLAKEAIRYGISDYLLKTELDGDTLLRALAKAEEECRRRKGEGEVSGSDGSDDKASSMISNLLIMRDISQRARMFLSEEGYLDDFAFIAFAFSFPSASLEKQWTSDDYKRLHDWEKDIIEKIMPSFFSSYFPVIPVAGKAGTLIYFVSRLSPDTWQAVSSRLRNKVAEASLMVTGIKPELLRTDVMSGRDSLRNARNEMERALTACYLDKDEDKIKPAALEVDSVFPRLENAIAAKEIVSCRACFSIIEEAVATVDHNLSQFVFMATALRSALSSGMAAIGLRNDLSSEDMVESVDFITKRSEAISFIIDTEDSVVSLLSSRSGAGGAVADKAREYVLQHIMDRISLSDVASYACVSPSYMSKSFKRVMGVSLVDYINSMKIEKAKEMLQEGKEDRIQDIALSLGFSNIYYFSKVFRKVVGMPPTEYLRTLSRP